MTNISNFHIKKGIEQQATRPECSNTLSQNQPLQQHNNGALLYG